VVNCQVILGKDVVQLKLVLVVVVQVVVIGFPNPLPLGISIYVSVNFWCARVYRLRLPLSR